MRARIVWLGLVSSALAMVWGVAAGAQTPSCLSTPVLGVAIYGGPSPIKNAPFTGVVKTSFEHKLADGNAIHTVRRMHEARDAAGRTMTEIEDGCFAGADGQMHERFGVSVNDPATRTSMSWQMGDDRQPKVVRVIHQPDRSQIQRPQAPADERQQVEAARAWQLQQQKEFKTEDLGIQSFNGISAHGTRTTRTIPAGEEGNDAPLVVVTEMWRSKELGLMLMAVNDDPRQGKTTTEYEELNVGEPDAGLFAAPADYTMQEQPQPGMVGGSVR